MTPIRYHLRFPNPANHYLEVEAVYPTEGRAELDLFLAVWTPGSYLVREYSRHIESLRVEGGSIEKTAKNRWRLSNLTGPACTLHYRVYCREMSVRTNWAEHDFALLNGAPTFLTIADSPTREHIVNLQLPPYWTHAITALPSPAPSTFLADSFDTLVDSPILCGTPMLREFAVNGRTHLLATVGDNGLFDHERAVTDLTKVIAEQHALWGVIPYERYIFLNVLTESGGGLEHKNCTVLMGSRYATRSRAAYLGDFSSEPARHGWLGLASHEFFHVWNGKRLRPADLGPFDYEHENYTRELWFAEGVTSYYDDLILARAGLLTQPEYFAALSRHIERLQATPGRTVRSVETSSFDAWIREYRPDENSTNATISYYTKGAVVAFLLDIEIRRATEDARSLDDVLRLAYQKYSGERGYTRADLACVIRDVAGASLDCWLDHALSSTEEFEYAAALDWLGLSFTTPEPSQTPWLGITTRVDNGRLVISQILRDSPAALAGLDVDDELVALNRYRIRPDQWSRRLEEHQSGETVELVIARRDHLRELPVTLAPKPAASWKLQVRADPSSDQSARLRRWLHQ